MPDYLARIGMIVFAVLFALALSSEHNAAGRALAAAASPVDPFPLRAVFAMDESFAGAGSRALPPAEDDGIAVQTAVAPPQPAITSDGAILASWYGPGLYGNPTACGQVYTPEILGVAHLTFRCGTLLTLTYGGRVVTVPVIDRGPYIAGRALDLSNATKLALGCTDLCTLRMQVLR